MQVDVLSTFAQSLGVRALEIQEAGKRAEASKEERIRCMSIAKRCITTKARSERRVLRVKSMLKSGTMMKVQVLGS
jgi:hypothetical protein